MIELLMGAIVIGALAVSYGSGYARGRRERVYEVTAHYCPVPRCVLDRGHEGACDWV